MRLDVATAVCGAVVQDPMPIRLDPANSLRDISTNPVVDVLYSDLPFINNMDEISYWIYTKRAPCLLKYDTLNKNSCMNNYKKPVSIHSIEGDIPSPKKKKRKLSLLDDGSVSTEKKNIYFDVSRIGNQLAIKSHKSDTLASNIDFNIKSSPIQTKKKKAKLQKPNRTTLYKKNKVITSTPKSNIALRRSVRRTAQGHLNNNNIRHLDSSFEVLHCDLTDDIKSPHVFLEGKNHAPKKSLGVEDDRIVANKNHDEKFTKQPVPNDEFEDISDVSGFTANYIRSTKVHSTKTPRNLRSKSKWKLIKESPCDILKDNTKTIVCINKSANTGMPDTPALNCSTDSSQNVVNLVTVKNNKKTTKVDKSTSLLKFMDSKNSKANLSPEKLETSNDHITNLDTSFQSMDSGTSRYPRRVRNNSAHITVPKTINISNSTKNSLDKRRKTSKNTLQHKNKSDRKENPEETIVSKTRSGRSIGLALRQSKQSVLVVSNSVDRSSSVVSMNVAITGHSNRQQNGSKTKHGMSTRNADRVKTHVNNSRSLRRESLRDRSGFAACFSDSDDGSEPLREKKFFC